MGRSYTLPITEPTPRPSSASTKVITRSATGDVSSRPSTNTITEPSHHHIHLPNFLHHDNNDAAPIPMPPPAETKSEAARPDGIRRQNSVQTRYMTMLLALDTIPRFHNILSSFFTWILLAGFVIFPGTFTTIQASISNDQAIEQNAAASTILGAVKNTGLIIIAGVCCGIGALGMIWLWWRWRQNYVWLLNKIFLPGCLNSLAGLISTLINVYTQQNGKWSVTAEVTAIATGSCMVILAVLFLIYNLWVLERVKRSHGREMASSQIPDDETVLEKVERKAMEPALEPGSVV
jgi:hypothetical protein